MLYRDFVWSNWPVQLWYSIYYQNDKHYWHWRYNNPETQQMEVKSKVKAQYLLFCCSATQIHEKWPATGSLLSCSPPTPPPTPTPIRAAWKSLYDVLSLTGWHHYASARLLHLWIQHFSHRASSHLNSNFKSNWEHLISWCFASFVNLGISCHQPGYYYWFKHVV